jgi:hypothetical protein
MSASPDPGGFIAHAAFYSGTRLVLKVLGYLVEAGDGTSCSA